jgi:hypothetical protein
VPNKGVPNPNSVGAGATGGTNAGTAGCLLYHKKTNTLFKTITGTAGGLLYHKKPNTLFKTITGTAGGLLYHKKN